MKFKKPIQSASSTLRSELRYGRRTTMALSGLVLLIPALLVAPASGPEAELKDLSINGGIQDGKARLVIETQLHGLTEDKSKSLFATELQHTIRITRERQAHTMVATFDILQGEPKELSLTITGEGEIKKATGDNLQDWSVREETNGTRSLVLRPRKGDKPLTRFTVNILAEHELKAAFNPVRTLSLSPPQPALFHGYVKVESASELDTQPANLTGLVPIEPKFLPESLRANLKPDEPEPLAYRFHGSPYHLTLNILVSAPAARRVPAGAFQLNVAPSDQPAAVTLNSPARVQQPLAPSIVVLA